MNLVEKILDQINATEESEGGSKGRVARLLVTNLRYMYFSY